MLMKAVEARKKAEVVHMHTTEFRNTHNHMATAIKRGKVIILSMNSCFLSFRCTLFLLFPPHYSHTELKDSGPQALFLRMHSSIRAEF